MNKQLKSLFLDKECSGILTRREKYIRKVLNELEWKTSDGKGHLMAARNKDLEGESKGWNQAIKALRRRFYIYPP